MAADGMQFPWRWNGDTISLNLGVIWEMSDERFLHHNFVERLWCLLKYGCVYLYTRRSGREVRAGIGGWIEFYNQKRLHSALGSPTPDTVNRSENETEQPSRQK